MHDLIDRWRRKATDKETAAKGYNRRCIHTKGVQLLKEANTLRQCADELEAASNAIHNEPTRDSASDQTD
jgi:hypothetical protein